MTDPGPAGAGGGASVTPAAPPAATAAAAPRYATPTAKDFKLAVKVLRKACFGSAGCNVTYRIEVTYLGKQELDPSKTYEVTYEVKGAEDQAINTFTVAGTDALVDEEEHASTARQSAVLTAVVVSVTQQ